MNGFIQSICKFWSGTVGMSNQIVMVVGGLMFFLFFLMFTVGDNSSSMARMIQIVAGIIGALSVPAIMSHFGWGGCTA